MHHGVALLLVLVAYPSTLLADDDDFKIPINRQRYEQLRQERNDWYRKTYGSLFDKASSEEQEREGAKVCELLIQHHDWRLYTSEQNPLSLKLAELSTVHGIAPIRNPFLRFLMMEQQLNQTKGRPSQSRDQSVAEEWIRLADDAHTSKLPAFVKGQIYLRAIPAIGGEGVVVANRMMIPLTSDQKKKVPEVYQRFLSLLPELLKDGSPHARHLLALQWHVSKSMLHHLNIKVDDWHQQIDEVLARLPEEVVFRQYLAGLHHKDTAWLVRGGGVAATVSEDAFKGFEAHLKEAQTHLEAGWRLANKQKNYPLAGACAHRMIPVGMGLAFPREDEALWFQRAISAYGANHMACSEYMLYLEPKWHGSIEEMYQFGDACYGTYFWEEDIPSFLLQVFGRISQLKQNPREYLASEEVWPLVEKNYESMLKHHGATRFTQTQYLRFAMASGKEALVKDLFQKLDGSPSPLVFTANDAHALDTQYGLKAKNRVVNATPSKGGKAPIARPKSNVPRPDPATLRQSQAEAATHQLVKTIPVLTSRDPSTNQTLGAMCLNPAGGLVVLVQRSRYSASGQTNQSQLQFLSNDGKLIREIPLSFAARTLAYCPDLHLYVAGSGKLAVFTPDGKLKFEKELEHIKTLTENKARLQQWIDDENNNRVKMKEANTRIYRAEMEKLQKKPEGERTEQEKAQLKSYQAMIDQFETNPHFKKLPPDEMIKALEANLKNVYSIAFHDKTLYLGCNNPTLRGGETVWAYDLDGSRPRLLLERLSATVNVMAIASDQGKLYTALVPQNIGVFSTEGKRLSHWQFGYTDETPLAAQSYVIALGVLKGRSLLALDQQGVVVQYSLSGEFQNVVCCTPAVTHSAGDIAVSPDGKTVYILEYDKPHVLMFERK